MSFILDALKKSEGERQRQTGPTMFEVKHAPRRLGLPAWAFVVAGLLALNLLGLVWVLTRDRPADTLVAHRTASADTVDASRDGVAAARTAQATGASPARQVIPPPPPAWTDSGRTAGNSSSAAAAAVDVAAAQGSLNPADYEPAIEPAAPAEGDPTGRGPDTTGRGAAPGELPTRDELPPAIANQIPDVRIDLHAYSRAAKDRFVFINMRRYDEGGVTPEGLRIDQITPEGAVLVFRGNRFLLRRE